MKIHMCAVCGMGMGSLAQLLKSSGHTVGGSDAMFYPPMSELLARHGIDIRNGFSADNVPPDTELMIVGNAVRSDNPEFKEALRRGLRYLSFPQALEEMYLKERRNIVVAGTHGKTTTSALIAWILHSSGLDPGFLIGGVLRSFNASSAPGKGRFFVVEGDEYHTALFDRAPKFLHYRPEIGVLTSVDFDHADIFKDLDACRETFKKFVSLIPSRGRLIACSDDSHVRGIAAGSDATESYGFGGGAGWRIEGYSGSPEGSSFRIVHGGDCHEVSSPLAGRHNALNATAAFIAASVAGVPAARILDGIRSYQGVRRRQEVRGVAGGITVIDDFAHHPTEVRETLSALRERYRGRRLWAVWEPRTNSSRRNFFQNDYPASFRGADRVVIAGVYHPEQVEPERLLSPERIARDILKMGGDARCLERVDDILEHLLGEVEAGDVVVIMSNGAFENIHERLLERLRARFLKRGLSRSSGS